MGYGVDSVILYTTLKISGLALAVCGVLAEHDFDVDSGCTEKPRNQSFQVSNKIYRKSSDMTNNVE